jgi:hypothetical protein
MGVICHLSFVIRGLSSVIRHSSFVIRHSGSSGIPWVTRVGRHLLCVPRSAREIEAWGAARCEALRAQRVTPGRDAILVRVRGASETNLHQGRALLHHDALGSTNFLFRALRGTRKQVHEIREARYPRSPARPPYGCGNAALMS